MRPDQIQAIRDCVAGSQTGLMTFPQIVARLSEMGVERYHADYSRQETTFYLPDGDSAIVESPHPTQETGDEFTVDAVRSAIRQSQNLEHTYPDFVRKTMAAGCIGYFVQITGRCVIYFGRRGESHIERFPT